MKKMYITYLNVFAALSVVLLHNNGIVHRHPTGRTWYSAIFIETLFYCAVPLFLMITGATLIDYKERYSTKVFFKKRIEKAFIPFLFWSLIGILYTWLKNKSSELISANFIYLLSNIFNTKYITIYWFFPALFAVYLCIPILSEINNKMKTFKYMIIVGFIFVSVLPFVCDLLSVEYNYELIPKLVYGYIIYVILGYYIDNKEIIKKYRIIIYLLGIFGFLSNFIGTAFLTEQGGDFYPLFRGAFNWPSILQSTAIFTFFKYASLIKDKQINNMISWFARKTFGIYLIHIYFVNELPNILGVNIYSLIWRVFGALFIFILCALITDLLQRMPVVKKIIP